MKYFFENLKNNIDFFLRQKFSFSRKNYSEKNPDSSGDLYTTDVLEKYLKIDFKDDLKVLDIGCKNWFYVKGEYSFFEKYCNNLILNGIELDANRLYSNFYSRREVAKFYTKGIDTNYIAGDFLNHNEKYDYMVWILPFVVEEPLLKWGLPMKYFQPQKMLQHAYDLLSEGGKIFIINQGEAEYEVQKSLCEKLNISYVAIGEVKSEILKYEILRYGILIKK